MYRWISVAVAVLTAGGIGAADLPWIAPKEVEPVPYQARLMPGGAIEIKLGEQLYVVNADFSQIPGWANFTAEKAENFSSITVKDDTLTAITAGFKLERSLKREAEAVIVTDKITNTTAENLPLIYRQYVQFDKLKEYRLCGYRIYSSRGNGTNSINATTIVMPENGGSLGMLALNDVFRVHFRAFAAKKMYGIGDDNLIVKPGVTQEMSFALFPSAGADYYDQINAMRRHLGMNYEIAHGFAFLAPYPPGVKTFNDAYDRIGKDDSVETIREWLNNKSADYVTDGSVSALGEQFHSSAWMKTAKVDVHKDFYKKIREARPSAQLFHYFHCFLDVKNSMDAGFDDVKILKPNGEQADYRNPALPLFLPVEGSAWARMQEKRLARLKDEFGLDGVFWDEFPYSASEYHYGQPWDGVSGDINPKTHEITQLKSSVALTSLPWRKRMVEWLADNKMMLIANGGGGYTKTMTDLFIKNKFIAFMETGSVTNLYTSHLSTPIGLGDHITERTELDCYRNMVKFLDYGSFYFYYHQQVEPFTHPTLTRYMFPTTPVELHEGYILGKERILTNRSGYYSFGGNEAAELHFFGADGCEVQRPAEKTVKDGKTYYKVELAEFESCAIVKQ